jgi:hypothetical protein
LATISRRRGRRRRRKRTLCGTHFNAVFPQFKAYVSAQLPWSKKLHI